jgi:choline monooxygenase
LSLTPGFSDNSEALYYFLYPNFCVNRYGQWMDTNIVIPTGPRTCDVIIEWYADEEVLQDRSTVEACIAASEQVQMEDIWLCERVQIGLESAAYRGREGRYAPTLETGEYMFHQKLHRDWERAVEEEAENKVS